VQAAAGDEVCRHWCLTYFVYIEKALAGHRLALRLVLVVEALVPRRLWLSHYGTVRTWAAGLLGSTPP
jgi:hypothetical protein